MVTTCLLHNGFDDIKLNNSCLKVEVNLLATRNLTAGTTHVCVVKLDYFGLFMEQSVLYGTSRSSVTRN